MADRSYYSPGSALQTEESTLAHLSSKGIFERVLGNCQTLQEGQRARIQNECSQDHDQVHREGFSRKKTLPPLLGYLVLGTGYHHGNYHWLSPFFVQGIYLISIDTCRTGIIISYLPILAQSNPGLSDFKVWAQTEWEDIDIRLELGSTPSPERMISGEERYSWCFPLPL